jgi:single-strand DNA-binding protein
MKRLTILGNLTKDAIVREFPEKSQCVINFSVAVDDGYKDRTGEWIKRTSYFDCSMWRKEDKMSKHLKKGQTVFVEGSPESECYQDREGKWVSKVKCRVQDVRLCGRPSSSNTNDAPAHTTNDIPAEQSWGGNDTSTDLPF